MKVKQSHTHRHIVRRSIALPQSLVDEVLRYAPIEHRDNWNRMFVTILQEYIARNKQKQFEQAMAEMAADRAIRKTSERIGREFQSAEEDGLDP